MVSRSWGFPLSLSLLLVIGLGGCSQAPLRETDSPELWLEHACRPGSMLQTVKGSVWLKAKSKEASGQFPAAVEAQADGSLILEATNLIGAKEAVIRVKNQRYEIEVPGKPARNERGTGEWGGIPLRWAPDLFLGRIPCPSSRRAQDLRLSRDPEGRLKVETRPNLQSEGEVFLYSFRDWAGSPWPEKLRWQRGTLVVDFQFDQPEPKTRSPQKWEAVSRDGEVKVRWKNRETLMLPSP